MKKERCIECNGPIEQPGEDKCEGCKERTGREKAIAQGNYYHEGNEIRKALLVEILGYFRHANQTTEQGYAEAAEKLLLIGYVFGVGGIDVAVKTMQGLNMPERYIVPIMQTLLNK